MAYQRTLVKKEDDKQGTGIKDWLQASVHHWSGLLDWLACGLPVNMADGVASKSTAVALTLVKPAPGPPSIPARYKYTPRTKIGASGVLFTLDGVMKTTARASRVSAKNLAEAACRHGAWWPAHNIKAGKVPRY
eukprot:352029-Chlamydomonas_euryale.AAC.4